MKTQIRPGIQTGLLEQNAIALPLAPPPLAPIIIGASGGGVSFPPFCPTVLCLTLRLELFFELLLLLVISLKGALRLLASY